MFNFQSSIPVTYTIDIPDIYTVKYQYLELLGTLSKLRVIRGFEISNTYFWQCQSYVCNSLLSATYRSWTCFRKACNVKQKIHVRLVIDSNIIYHRISTHCIWFCLRNTHILYHVHNYSHLQYTNELLCVLNCTWRIILFCLVVCLFVWNFRSHLRIVHQ